MRQTDEHLDAVTRLWDAHMRAAFPARLRGMDLVGIDMVMLDADTAGCVSSWLHNRGAFDSGRREVIASCIADLNRVLPALIDRQEIAYYTRLREMAMATLV